MEIKFNGYIVHLKQRENIFTGSLITSGKTVSANFKKIGKELFAANFKNQVEFKFLEKAAFKNKNKEILVLLPMISEYNKRKLTKISKFLSPHIQNTNTHKPFTPEGGEKNNLVVNLLTVEKFLKVRDLLDFFLITRDRMIEFLVEQEIRKAVKIINFTDLFITSYENFQDYLKELNTIFTDCYTNRIKTVTLEEIQSTLKLPQSPLLLKYLLTYITHHFSFKMLKDKILFQTLPLTDTEKNSLVEIETILRKNKISIFSIENIIKNSHLLYKEVNNSLWFLVETGQVVQLNETYFIFGEDLQKIVNKLKKYKRNEGEMMDIKAFRELTLFSRKHIIPLLEYFDNQRITQRIENQRKILLPT
jgi:hypothetical protein